MARPDALQAEGVIVEALPKSRWRVELSNGHRLIGWLGRRESRTLLVLGQLVRIEISPGDFSHGRLLQQTNNSKA